ncbi:MAG TPA: response regulator transcription factor [Rhodanobacter sp.]
MTQASLTTSPHGPRLNVAVLDDDAALREEILIPGLQDFGFAVTGAGTAAGLYRLMLSQQFDMVVLDISLPDEDGVTVARHLRELSGLGIIMLTGERNSRMHVRALNSGADTYLTKPVDIDVLAAALHSLHRRLKVGATSASSQVSPASTGETGEWRLDTDGWCLIAPNGTVLALTAPERCVLNALAAGRGAPVAREKLIEALSEDVYGFDPHRLEMLVHRLRRKTLNGGAGNLPLMTSRGNGYLFVMRP